MIRSFLALVPREDPAGVECHFWKRTVTIKHETRWNNHICTANFLVFFFAYLWCTYSHYSINFHLLSQKITAQAPLVETTLVETGLCCQDGSTYCTWSSKRKWPLCLGCNVRKPRQGTWWGKDTVPEKNGEVRFEMTWNRRSDPFGAVLHLYKFCIVFPLVREWQSAAF